MRRMIPLIAAVTLVAAVSIPLAVAAGSKAPQAISPKAAVGTWSWVNSGSVVWKTTHDGTQYLSGTEDGTWTGTFEGTSVDAFDGEIHADGSLFGLLRIAFTGTVAGKTGTLEILTTWMVPERHPSAAMTGRWHIVSGTDELANLHGQGTWAYAGSDPSDHASYTGIIKEVVPPTPSPSPSTSPSTSTSPSP